jgi:hypothetical protein
MESTCAYTSLHISSLKDRVAYVKAMRRCRYICSKKCNGDDLSGMLSELKKLRKSCPTTFIRRFEIFSNTKKHYILGIDHSLEIVSSIHRRFVAGGRDSDTTFVCRFLGEFDEV